MPPLPTSRWIWNVSTMEPGPMTPSPPPRLRESKPDEASWKGTWYEALETLLCREWAAMPGITLDLTRQSQTSTICGRRWSTRVTTRFWKPSYRAFSAMICQGSARPTRRRPVATASPTEAPLSAGVATPLTMAPRTVQSRGWPLSSLARFMMSTSSSASSAAWVRWSSTGLGMPITAHSRLRLNSSRLAPKERTSWTMSALVWESSSTALPLPLVSRASHSRAISEYGIGTTR